MKTHRKGLDTMDLQIAEKRFLEKKSQRETANELGVSRQTVVMRERREPMHLLMMQILEDKKAPLEFWAERLIRDADAVRSVKEDGQITEVEDNAARTAARQDALKIFGAYAPQKHDITSFARASDAELDAKFEEAERRLGMDECSGECGASQGTQEGCSTEG